MAFYEQRCAFNARLIARGFLDNFDFKLAALAPATIHAIEYAGPVTALCAAGTGMNFDIGVIAIGLAGEHGLNLPPFGLHFNGAKGGDALVFGGGIIFEFAQLDQGEGVVQAAFERLKRIDAIFQKRAFTHQRLRCGGVVPKFGMFRLGV